MGMIQSKQGGYFVLETKIGAATIKQCFMVSDKSLEEIEKLPNTDDFYMNIPDQYVKTEEK